MWISSLQTLVSLPFTAFVAFRNFDEKSILTSLPYSTGQGEGLQIHTILVAQLYQLTY